MTIVRGISRVFFFGALKNPSCCDTLRTRNYRSVHRLRVLETRAAHLREVVCDDVGLRDNSTRNTR